MNIALRRKALGSVRTESFHEWAAPVSHSALVLLVVLVGLHSNSPNGPRAFTD